MPGPVQLKFNLKIAPAGIEPLVDVSAQCSEFKIVTSRDGVTIPPNGATGRGSTAAGAINEQLVITCHSAMDAASLFATLREVIYTDTAELDFEGTHEDGAVSEDNPQYSGTAVLLNLEAGGAVNALRGQTITLPITEAGITATTTV